MLDHISGIISPMTIMFRIMVNRTGLISYTYQYDG
jgi:hypothetical protein